MNIILVRHAIAMEREDFAAQFKKDDSLRPLVMKGKKRMLKVARSLQKFVPEVEVLVTSPYTRALQTTEVLRRFYPKAQIIEASELVPSAPPEAFLNWLHALNKKAKNILVVGHEPQMGIFASYCLSGDKENFVDFKKSGALCMEIDALPHLSAGTAKLKWLLPPKMFGA